MFIFLKKQTSHLADFKKLSKVAFFTLIFWFAGILIFYYLLLASPLPAEVQTLKFAAFISSAMGITLSLPSAPSNIGIYNLTIIFLVKMLLIQEGITISDELQAQIVASSIILHFGSLIPDFLAGIFSYITVSRKALFTQKQ